MMKKTLALALALGLCVCLLAEAALAKRVGGGGSFGSRSTYSRSYSKPVSPAPYAPASPASPGQQMNSQTQSPTTSMGRSPGMFSRFGWGMGGLLAGGLLGSMLFGGGMGWGGGIGIMDILLIGLIVFLAFKLLRRKPSAQQGPTAHGNMGGASRQVDDPHSRAESNWDRLRSDNAAPPAAEGGMTGGFGPGAPAEPAAATAGPVVPEGFNVPEFLEGAKTVYARLQHSWDRRDLDDIALFTTPEVLAEIRRQAALDPQPSKTELLLVNARLLEFREDTGDTVSTVLFDVLLREDANEDRPKQIREVWHFSRPTGDLAANWRLEGIQQLED